jgi:serine/threonine protein kinase
MYKVQTGGRRNENELALEQGSIVDPQRSHSPRRRMALMMADAPTEDSDVHSERVGELIAGKYRLETEIGSGGMGVVYKAYREDLHSHVALKLLRPAFGFDPQTVARFLQEARTAAALRSPHVARVQDFGALPTGADGAARPFIVMEYLNGRDLGEVLKVGQLGVGEAVDYIIQACHAIAEAHAQGIVHRDLKPANLFLCEQNEIKVLDFGIAKPGYAPTSRLTRAGLSLGSPHYMSPEQLDNPRQVDGRADIYSFGICLYELLTGSVPFNGETISELVMHIVQGTPMPLDRLRRDVPAGLAQAIERAFARDPSSRFQRVEDFVSALAPFAPPRSRRLIELLAPFQAPTPSDFVRALSSAPPPFETVSIGPRIAVAARQGEQKSSQRMLVKRVAIACALLLLFLFLFVGLKQIIGRPDLAPPVAAAVPVPPKQVTVGAAQAISPLPPAPMVVTAPPARSVEASQPAEPVRVHKADVSARRQPTQPNKTTLNLDNRARQ